MPPAPTNSGACGFPDRDSAAFAELAAAARVLAIRSARAFSRVETVSEPAHSCCDDNKNNAANQIFIDQLPTLQPVAADAVAQVSIEIPEAQIFGWAATLNQIFTPGKTKKNSVYYRLAPGPINNLNK